MEVISQLLKLKNPIVIFINELMIINNPSNQHKSGFNPMKSTFFLVRSPFSNAYWRYKPLKPIFFLFCPRLLPFPTAPTEITCLGRWLRLVPAVADSADDAPGGPARGREFGHKGAMWRCQLRPAQWLAPCGFRTHRKNHHVANTSWFLIDTHTHTHWYNIYIYCICYIYTVSWVPFVICSGLPLYAMSLWHFSCGFHHSEWLGVPDPNHK